MGITVLLPGGFKPPHMGHVALAKAYAKNPKVDQVRVLVGPTERDGITRDQSILALQLLLKDPKIVVVPTEYESPMVAAFETILNLPKDDTGTYALGASSKGGDFERINMFSKSIEQYKTKPTKDGRTAPKGIKIDDSLKVDVSPILYKGRTDGRDGDGISASTMRQDLRNGDRENFATNYPGVDSKTVNQLFDMFSKTVKEPEEKKSKKKKLKEAVRFGRLLEQRAINRLVIMQLLKEGGNVFKDEEGKPATKDINKADVEKTVEWLETKSGLALKNNMLGTTGKKDTSGDLDLGVDKKEVDQDSLISTLVSNGIDKKDIKKTGTNVHVKTPIAGNPKNGFVQSDFMFNDNVEFMKFSMQGGAQGSKYKGVDKHLLLASIASAQGMKWSYLNGLIDRKTNEPITKDPNEIATKLLGDGAKPEDLANVEAILNFIKNKNFIINKKNYEDLVAQARQDFSKKGLELPTKEQLLAQSKKNQDNKEDLKEVLKRLIEMQIIKEADGARIQHPEDLIYWKGSEGAKAALSALQNIDPKNVSVKWDGSPAVVFGYDDNGDFIFTDKNAFSAKGYDGKTKSPKDLENMLKDRGARGGKDHSKFAGNMKSVFDLVKNSVPFDKDTKEPKGFYKGDMLYFGTTNDPKEKGYLFKKGGNYIFTPNVVTYEVPENSDLGKQIGKSKAGVVVHSFETPDGKSQDVSKVKFNPDSGLLVVPPVVSSEAPKADKAAVSKASSAVSAASSVDELLKKEKLESMKMTDLPEILYTYTNNRVEDLNKLSSKDFESFVSSSSKISEKKKQKLLQYLKENKAAFDSLFNAVKAIADLKNSLISQLDSKSGEVKASIGNQPGGEGYVVKTSAGPIKLVNRGGFTAANRAVQR